MQRNVRPPRIVINPPSPQDQLTDSRAIDTFGNDINPDIFQRSNRNSLSPNDTTSMIQKQTGRYEPISDRNSTSNSPTPSHSRSHDNSNCVDIVSNSNRLDIVTNYSNDMVINRNDIVAPQIEGDEDCYIVEDVVDRDKNGTDQNDSNVNMIGNDVQRQRNAFLDGLLRNFESTGSLFVQGRGSARLNTIGSHPYAPPRDSRAFRTGNDLSLNSYDRLGAYSGGAHRGGAYRGGAHGGGAHSGGAHRGGAHGGREHIGGAHRGGTYSGGAYSAGAYSGEAHRRGAYGGGAHIMPFMFMNRIAPYKPSLDIKNAFDCATSALDSLEGDLSMGSSNSTSVFHNPVRDMPLFSTSGLASNSTSLNHNQARDMPVLTTAINSPGTDSTVDYKYCTDEDETVDDEEEAPRQGKVFEEYSLDEEEQEVEQEQEEELEEQEQETEGGYLEGGELLDEILCHDNTPTETEKTKKDSSNVTNNNSYRFDKVTYSTSDRQGSDCDVTNAGNIVKPYDDVREENDNEENDNEENENEEKFIFGESSDYIEHPESIIKQEELCSICLPATAYEEFRNAQNCESVKTECHSVIDAEECVLEEFDSQEAEEFASQETEECKFSEFVCQKAEECVFEEIVSHEVNVFSINCGDECGGDTTRETVDETIIPQRNNSDSSVEVDSEVFFKRKYMYKEFCDIKVQDASFLTVAVSPAMTAVTVVVSRSEISPSRIDVRGDIVAIETHSDDTAAVTVSADYLSTFETVADSELSIDKVIECGEKVPEISALPSDILKVPLGNVILLQLQRGKRRHSTEHVVPRLQQTKRRHSAQEGKNGTALSPKLYVIDDCSRSAAAGADRVLPCPEWTVNLGSPTTAGIDRVHPCPEWTVNLGSSTTVTGIDRVHPCPEWTVNLGSSTALSVNNRGRCMDVNCITRRPAIMSCCVALSSIDCLKKKRTE